MTLHDRVQPNTTLRGLRPALHRVRGALVATIVIAAAALAIVVGVGEPASAGPQPVMAGYVPLPSDDFQGYLESINTDAGPRLDFTVGITNAASGSVMYYDQWEDGFEADLANPVQSSTLVFGDANTGNGDAADHCDACAGDLLPQGAALIMRNNVDTPRSASQQRFDGGDKVASTRGFAITAGGFTTAISSVLSGVVSAYDTTKYGTQYTIPVGEDTPFPTTATDPFSYVGASIMTATDNTVVEVDLDADGTPDVTETIDEGEATFIDGGMQEGATVRSSAPVQVHMLTGRRGSGYEARSYTLFSDDLLSNDYMSPAGTGTNTYRTANYLFNPSDSSITVTPTCTGCAGTITVPAQGTASLVSPLNQAVRFSAPAGDTFIAIAAVGGQAADNDGRLYDWGYSMIPTSQLSTQVVLGWAPGNSNNPPTTSGNEERYNPVWVTTLNATTVHVDRDGNPATGLIGTSDCFGARHDQDIPVTALASTRLFDPTDGDMTGARIYTCDGTEIAGAWGQDPAFTTTGAPGFDAGYTIIPTTTMVVEKTASLVEDVDGDGGFGPGDTMTYEIAIADAGSLAFTNVELEDVLPPGLTYVPDSTRLEVDSVETPLADDEVPPAATAFPLDDAISLPDIDAGATVYVRFEAEITEPWSLDSNVLTNTACVVATEAQACDTSQTALTTADVSLTKTETADPTYVGEDAVFQIRVDNAGPDDAPGVEVTDLLPAGLTFVSADPSQGAYDDSTGLWAVGTVPADGFATLELVATVEDDDPITNVAEVSGGGYVDPDSQPVENPLGPGTTNPPDQDDEDSASVDVDVAADLRLDKTETASPTYVGDDAVFQVTVGNDGPSDATGVEVGDLLPAGLTFVSADPEVGTYDDGTGIWTVGDLDAGNEVTLEITATVDTDGVIINTAQVIAADQDDPDSTPGNDVPAEDDQASAGVSVGPLVDLSLTKTQTATPTYLGDDATYVVTVHNDGPSDATGVEVTDLLPAGVTHVGSDASQGSYSPGTGLWTVGDLDAGDSATLTIDATVDVLSAVNVAEVTDVDQDDADSQPAEDELDADDPPNQDDEGAATVTLDALADLSLTKTIDGTPPSYVGDDATFEIVVTNDGPSPATDVEVTDLLPAGLTYVSDDGAGDYDDATGIWTVGALAVDGIATLRITATVDTTQVTNSAEVTDATEDDPDSNPDNDDPQEDDQDSVEVTVDPLVDLSLTKALTTTPTYLGDEAAFTITVTNAGPSAATGVQVTDQLPAGLTYVDDDGAGDYDDATGIWDVGTIASGGSRTLTITVQVDDLTATNYAQVSDVTEDDPDSQPGTDELTSQNPPDQDDEDSASVSVEPLADLSLSKTSSPSSVDQGDDATFSISVTNDGPSDATGVEITDVLPAGVTYVTSDPSQGSYSSVTGIWTVGDLDVGDTATLDIDVTVDDAGTITNTAQVTDVDQDDPDSTPDNDDPTEDDQDSTTLSSDPVIDLSVTKGVSAGSAHVGSNVTYTVTVANDGPSNATGVQVTDQLPAGVTYVGHDASQGSYSSNTGLWNVGSVDDGDDATITITVRVDDPGAIANFAQVTDADQLDTDSQPAEDPLGPGGTNPPDQDDEATAQVVGVQIDLELDVAADATQVDVGDEVTFTVTLTNQGPSAATGVSVADLLPPGLTFVSASTATGSYVDGVWTVGDLARDQTVTLQVVARVAASGPLAYGGQVETAVQPDVDSTPSNDVPSEDDQDVVTITGVEADLSLTKTVDDPTPGLGDLVTYTLTVTNDGPATATNVIVEDVLPSGVVWVSDSSGGDYDPDTGAWDVGTLADGASATLAITVRTTTAGPIANRASVIEVDQPDPDSTPDNDDPAEDDEDTVTVTPEPASVSGLIWLDRDGDGRYDDGESPIEGVTVLLFDDDGNLVSSTETDADGRYEFTGLPVGTYVITIDEGSLPDTIDGQTYDPDDVFDASHEVTLVAGEQVVDVDFGFEPVVSPIDQIEEELTQIVDDVLARTGVDALWQLRVGLALVLLGGGFVLLARRRRPGTA